MMSGVAVGDVGSAGRARLVGQYTAQPEHDRSSNGQGR
jgi:hypothetical protein